tara:strand:+ start:394 stop:720 length:327 start_codon:yes stop_codon:yes gene_type:complete
LSVGCNAFSGDILYGMGVFFQHYKPLPGQKNTIVFEPEERGIVNSTSILQILNQIHPKKNSIISKFENLGTPSESAFDTQSLLELKNCYCAPKRSLECTIENYILKNK